MTREYSRRAAVAALAATVGAGLAACSSRTTSAGATRTTPTKTPVPADDGTVDGQLRSAAWTNDISTARQLIGRGANVNAKDATQQSAYLISTSEGFLELLRLTLAHGAIVDDKDSWNGTGLIRAAERGHYLIVGQLLRSKIDKNHVNRIGYQAIHEAIWLGEDTPSYASTVRTLAAGSVELTRRSGSEGLTPLDMARQRGYRTLEKVLTTVTDPSPVADPNLALLQAATSGDADLTAKALRAGANIETRDANKRTPLLLAVTGDHLDVARLLVSLGASADAVDAQQDTPWLVTGVTGSVPMLEALLPARPNLKLRNRYGGVSIIPASERGHVEYVRRVVKTGIDVNHVNDLGWTALLEAVILGDGGTRHQEIVRILLGAGADRSLADKDGVTPLQHAKAKGYNEIAAILQQ